MVDTTNVTVGGGSAVLTISGNDYVAAHASMFASMAMQLADVANSFYTAPGGGTLFAVANDMGNVEVTGSAASSTILVGDGSTLSYHGSSNGTIAAGSGNDTVIASAGNDTIALGSGDNDVELGTGNSYVYSEGTDSIVAGSGIDTLEVHGSNSSVYGGYGVSGYTGTSMLVNDESGTNTIIFAATKGSLVYGSNNTFTTVVAFGDTAVYGGSKGDHLYAGNGATIVLTGDADGNILVANDGRYANGNFVKLDGGLATGDNQFWAGSGNSTLIGGTGADTLVAGSGFATITGGQGKGNDFLFFSTEAGGNATITDFGAATGNTIFLAGYGTSAGQTAFKSAVQEGSNTVVTLSDGSLVTTINLENFNKVNLAATNFVGTSS